MNNKKVFLTEEGLQKLQAELQELKTVKRKEVSERIQFAKDLGDLSENAEYSDAKEEQGFIEARINEIDQMLKNVEVIGTPEKSDLVQIGSTVTVRDSKKKDMVFTIVGSSEADPIKQRISNESPLGKAFLNQRVNDTVQVKTPVGEITYTIVSIA